MDNLQKVKFSEIDINDPFFDSLKENYLEFGTWFHKKSIENQEAYVYVEDNHILDFLYLKDEDEPLKLEGQTLPSVRRLKVGTFKIERRGTNRGERFMKKILDAAILGDFPEIYVTMFNDTEELNHLQHFFEKYGFNNIGRKRNPNGREEIVLLREMATHTGDAIRDYPLVKRS